MNYRIINVCANHNETESNQEFCLCYFSRNRKKFKILHFHKMCIYKPETLPLVPKPELPELPPLPSPLPAMLYGSSSGIGILGRFLMSNGRCTAEEKND